MKRQLLRLVLLATLLAGGIAASTLQAIAQAMPNMDLSWGLRMQQGMWDYNQAYAAQIAQQCYQYSMMLRAQGYYGPVDCGANAATLQQSIARLNGQYQEIARAWERDSWATGQAIDRTGRAITGQNPVYNCRWFYNQWMC